MLLPDLLNGALVPGLIGYGATGMLAVRSQRRPAATLITSFGPWIAVLVAFVAMSGGLPFAAATPHRAVGEVALLLAVTLPLQRLLARGRVRTTTLAVVLAMASLLWCLQPLSAIDAVILTLAVPSVILVVARLAQSADSARIGIPVLIIMALGAAGVGVISRAGLASGFAFAVATAYAGWLLQMGGFRARLAAPPIELMPLAAFVAAVSADIAATSLVPAWPLLLLVLCPFVSIVLMRSATIARFGRRAVRRSMVILGGAALMALIANLLAVVTSLFVD